MDKLTDRKKKLLKEFVNNTCESCNKITKELHIHRIRRGWQGGKYNLRNVMVLCHKCHGLFHGNEFTRIRSK